MHRAALVTGSARRIGRAISLALAGDGYAVALHCHRSEDHARALASEIESAGGRAEVVVADLSDVRALPGLVDDAARRVGPLTALVNNASLFEPDSATELDPALWDRHMAINLRAPVLLSHSFAGLLPEDVEGAVVNIADQRVLKPTPDYFSYGVSKSGLWAATRMLAQALAPRIRVNAVGPGPTLPNLRQTDEAFRRQQQAVPLGHGPTADEVAEAVLFLVKAPSITGQLMLVDGGQHLAWATPDVIDTRG